MFQVPQRKENEPVVSNSKLTNNFAGLLTSGLRPDVACRPPLYYSELLDKGFKGKL
jgi:hypothetical protein